MSNFTKIGFVPTGSKGFEPISTTDNEVIYLNTSNPVEIETIRANKLNKVSRSVISPLEYPTSAKGARQVIAKRENVVAHTDAQGLKYQDPWKVTMSLEASNGAINQLNAGNGAAATFANAILQQAMDLIKFTFNEAGADDYYTIAAVQSQLDNLLYGVCKWDNETPLS